MMRSPALGALPVILSAGKDLLFLRSSRFPVRVALLAVLIAGTPGLTSAQSRIQVGTRVAPDTVTVGDPFVVLVRVRVAAGATVDFPQPPDTSGPVQPLDPLVLRDTVIGGETDYTATYRLAGWDVGQLPIALEDLVVRQNGEERRVAMGELSVFVRSVLPADTAQRDPKPARPPIDLPVSNWWKWLAAILAALLLAALVWYWRRRRNRARPPVVIDPLKAAEEEFARVESLGLVDAGERGRYVALMVDVVRDYLARRVGTPASLTGNELTAVLRRRGKVPLDRLAPLLTETDLVKFARYQVTADRARHLASEARAVVRQAHEATQPPPEIAATEQPAGRAA